MNTTSAVRDTVSAIMNSTTDFNGTTGSILLSPSSITSHVPWDLAWQSNNTSDPWVTTRSQHINPQFTETTPMPTGMTDLQRVFLILLVVFGVPTAIGLVGYLIHKRNNSRNRVGSGLEPQPNERLTQRQRYLRSRKLKRRRRRLFNCCATRQENSTGDDGDLRLASESLVLPPDLYNHEMSGVLS